MKRQARIHKGKRSWYVINYERVYYQRAYLLDIHPWLQVEIGDIPRQIKMRIEKWSEGVGFR